MLDQESKKKKLPAGKCGVGVWAEVGVRKLATELHHADSSYN